MAETKAKIMRIGKVYQLRKSAIRAAREDGYKDGEFTVKESVREDGWYYLPKSNSNRDIASEATAEVTKEEATDKIVPPPPVEEPAPEVKLEIVHKSEEPPKTAAEKTVEEKKKSTRLVFVDKPNKSTVASPTKMAREIAEAMWQKNHNVTRREVMNECVRQGIAFYTARTQYQLWSQSKKAEQDG